MRSLLEVHAIRLELRRELIALASQTLGGGLDVSLAAAPRLSGVVHLNERFRQTDALRHELLEPTVQALVLLGEELVLLLVPRHLLVALRRALPVRDVVPAPRLNLLPLRRQLLGELLHVILRGLHLGLRLGRPSLLLADVRLGPLELLAHHVELGGEIVEPSLGGFGSKISVVDVALKSSVGAAAALELHLLELLLHHVQVAVALPHRVLEVLAEGETVGETGGGVGSVSRREDARREFFSRFGIGWIFVASEPGRERGIARVRAPNARAGVKDRVDVSSDARGFARSMRRATEGRGESFVRGVRNLTSALVPWYSLDSCRIVASLESCAACCMESTPCGGSILATSSMLATWSRALRSCGETSRPDRKGSRWKSFTTLHSTGACFAAKE